MLSQSRYIVPQGRSGKVIRVIPGHFPGLGQQLPKIDIKNRFIVQVLGLPMIIHNPRLNDFLFLQFLLRV